MEAMSFRVCRTNLQRFSLPLADWERQGTSVECLECLAQCGDCEAGPFVEAGGEAIFADDLADLSVRLERLATKPPVHG